MKTLVAWSSGKESAWCLYTLQQGIMKGVEVVGLLTTVNDVYARVAMHAVREELLKAQAEAAGVPLWRVPIPSPCSNEEYEEAMARVIVRARDEGVTAIAFGDVFLEDVRAYREERLRGTGLSPLFPLWRIPTDILAREMIKWGLRARLTCLNPKLLPRSFIGREFDSSFLSDLPPAVDPCGERGEFHTYVYDGPMFRHPVPVLSGERVERDGFLFMDLRLTDAESTS